MFDGLTDDPLVGSTRVSKMYQYLEAMRLAHQLRAELKDISFEKLYILSKIKDEPLQQKDACLFLPSSMDVTRIIDVMVRDKMVKRLKCVNDRRSLLLKITEEGLHVLALNEDLCR